MTHVQLHQGEPTFVEMMQLQQATFVEEELSVYYGKMIAFVKKADLALQAAEQAQPTQRQRHGRGGPPLQIDANDKAQLQGLVIHFAKSWKEGIRRIDTDVIQFFSNYRRGVEILRAVLTQLLLYYTRFIEIVNRCYPRGRAPFQGSIINIQAIMFEIKRVSRSFD